LYFSPKVGVVVVKKRINTRFFAKTGPQLGNPPPGTIIDTEVTKPEWYVYAENYNTCFTCLFWNKFSIHWKLQYFYLFVSLE
jgi:hypothetical protein